MGFKIIVVNVSVNAPNVVRKLVDLALKMICID
jgi:hypothetical protein